MSTKGIKTTGVLTIIDGNSLINRAYYAMQRPMITKEGLYTHGVYGFLNMLNKIKKDHNPTHIVVTFDMKAPTFRHLEYSEYKAGRRKMPIELAMQMPLLKEVLSAMNIKILEIEGYEADDIIGTVAKAAENTELLPLIITGDRDALQLASDKTRVLITKKGISEFEMFDDKKMLEVYGLTPSQFIDYKGLCGDKSDNIPGIPGVGEKTALKLLSEFATVEDLIKNSDKISNAKTREKVEENAQIALMSKRLATINTNVPIDFDFVQMAIVEPDYDELINIYIKLEFNSFLKKLKTDGKGLNPKASTQDEKTDFESLPVIKEEEPEKYEYKIIEDISLIKEKISREVEQKGFLCVKTFSDNNHKDVPLIFGMSFVAQNTAYYIREAQNSLLEETVKFISSEQIPLCGHNLKEDYYALLSNFDFASEANIFNTFFDIEVAEYLLDPAKSNYAINTLAFEYLHNEIQDLDNFFADNGQLDMFSDSSKKYAEYGAILLAAIFDIFKIQKSKLKVEELEKIASELEFPLIEVLASMEKEGFRLDTEALSEIGRGIKSSIDDLTTRIYELAGSEFNINSPQQLSNILFEKLELPAGKKTKKGYSTNAEILEKLIDQHPIIPLILEYRSLTKLNGTYIEGLIPLRAEDGKIHAHFQQTVTATGRISCTEPNLQNIPIRQELGRKIRTAFVPRNSDHILVGADYSQIELRVLAHLSEEENLILAFNAGEDIHRLTASKVFNVPLEEVTKIQRSNAKAVNFGVIYGMSGFGLSSELNISRKDAEKYIKDYFEKYKAVKQFMDEQVSFCKQRGYATTIMNRKRKINEIKASNFVVRSLGERLAMNTPIQGSAADIIKLAMISTYKELKNQGLKSKLILQVHDELIIDTLNEEKEKVIALLTDCMENAIKLKVKMVADLNIGNNWYELK